MLLRDLAGSTGHAAAFIVTADGDEALVEDASIPNAIGRRLRAPGGLLVGGSRYLDLLGERLSIGWIELLGWRPGSLQAEPIPGRAAFLLLASADAGSKPEALRRAALALGPILDRSTVTWRQQETSLRLAALIDNLPLPIVFADARTVEVFLNDQALHLLGIAAADATEASVAAAFQRLIGKAPGGVETRLGQDSKALVAFEINHGERCFEVESRWIEDDRLVGRLWMLRDVTEEREATRFKDELVSTVSHELRTPLTSIIGALSLLGNGRAPASPDQVETLIAIARRNSERLAGIVDDLLDMHKIRSGHLQLRLRPVDAVALVGDAIEQYRPAAAKRQVSVTFDSSRAALPARWDPDRILQVIANLLSNAGKFSPEGGAVRVRLRQVGKVARLTVSDAGPGIAPDFRPRLFTRFAQDTGKANRGGTGLGLAISKEIVSQHGGSIMLEEHDEPGATLRVDLPLN